jgi:hypothetical protein
MALFRGKWKRSEIKRGNACAGRSLLLTVDLFEWWTVLVTQVFWHCIRSECVLVARHLFVHSECRTNRCAHMLLSR